MEEEFENFKEPLKVSYLQARDPSILSWNRHGIDNVRHNLEDDFLSEDTQVQEEDQQDDCVKVYLRIKGGVDYKDLYTIQDDTLVCKVPDGSYTARNIRDGEVFIKKYSFTKIFGPQTRQEDLFNDIIKAKILSFINGKNSTLLAYGASGAGKTFTMVGNIEAPGVIPRALEYLFRTLPEMEEIPVVKPLPNDKVELLDAMQKHYEKQNLLQIILASQAVAERFMHVKTYKSMQQRLSNETVATIEQTPEILGVWVSFAEIYNEYIYDLLQPPPLRGQQRPKLKVGGLQNKTYIKNLKYVYVKSGLEAYQILQYGIHNLNYAATALNSHSSRSHSIFTIRLVQGSDVDNTIVSSFNFCDLAGSERLKKTMNVGDRLKESNNINTSLLVLGRCISNIRDGQYKKENKMPPFRESKLTQLFQRALMGKEDIVMMVNINPSRDMFDETHHALNFSAIAKEIIREDPPQCGVLPPGRFSMYMERKSLLTNIEDIDREEEIRLLNDRIAELILHLSEERQMRQEAIELERAHIRMNFQEIIEIKDRRLEAFKAQLTKLLKEKEGREEVITISDDEQDEEYEEQIDSLKLENENLQKLLEKSTAEMQTLKSDNQSLQSAYEKQTVDLRKKEEEISELVKTLNDAELNFKSLLQENTILRNENYEYECKVLKLEDSLNTQRHEAEVLMSNNRMLIEESECLYNEIDEILIDKKRDSLLDGDLKIETDVPKSS